MWIGSQSIIKQGIHIGDGSVIGANSFVNKDVPPYSIVFGSPAQFYKYRFSEEMIGVINQIEYWNSKPRVARELINNIQLFAPNKDSMQE